MVKQKFIFLLIFTIFFSSCNGQVNRRLEKKLNNFDKKQIKYDIFNKYYVLEGYYETKKDFEPIIYPKSENYSKYISTMVILDNGKIFFGTSSNSRMMTTPQINLNSDGYNGVLVLKKGKPYVYRAFITHAILGIGGGKYIKKMKMLIKDSRHIYVQDGHNCFIYVLANDEKNE